MDDLDAKGKHFDFSSSINKKMQQKVFEVQETFCEEVERLEGFEKFSKSKWKTEGGYGVTQFLEHDDGIFEKVCICASVASGILTTSQFLMLKDKNVNVPTLNSSQMSEFFTTGLSGVVYPKNPNVPTLNFSYKYFEMNCGSEEVWWFGGETDLIPYILHSDDCQHFHEVFKSCCDKHDKSYYKILKKNCDEHYYLKHRGERRGIGGIFFDNLNSPSKDCCFRFVSACMNSIIPSYIPIVRRNKDKSFLHNDRQWQLLQRGRSVEFGLICDKATEFALMTPGVQHENILIFLPPLVKWQYNHTPQENSKEHELLTVLRNPREWI